MTADPSDFERRRDARVPRESARLVGELEALLPFLPDDAIALFGVVTKAFLIADEDESARLHDATAHDPRDLAPLMYVTDAIIERHGGLAAVTAAIAEQRGGRDQ